nr:RNA-directed DNA polymerase, eukaryota [Tanacetum cinerariifolium]
MLKVACELEKAFELYDVGNSSCSNDLDKVPNATNLKFVGKWEKPNDFMYFVVLLDPTMKTFLVEHGFRKMITYHITNKKPLTKNEIDAMVEKMIGEVKDRMEILFGMYKESQLVEALLSTQDWIKRERMEINVDEIKDLLNDDEVLAVLVRSGSRTMDTPTRQPVKNHFRAIIANLVDISYSRTKTSFRSLDPEIGYPGHFPNEVEICKIKLKLKTICKIKWGEALDIEDNVDSSFGRKHLCIKTKLPLSILESFKVNFKGKVYMVRAKELFTWSPIFLGQKEMEYTSNEDSDVGPQKVPDRSQFCEEGSNDDRVSDVEEVSETKFGDNSSIPINHIDEFEKQQSEDPFNIYRLLRKQPGDESHEATCDHVDLNVIKKGRSILGVMEDMIQVGKAMGYSMDGCMNDLEQIIGTQGVGDGTQVAFFVWEATVFKKDYATILDNFVAIYGTWLPSNSKVLFMAFMLRSRRGSCFNPTSARVFNQFISTLGLVDVKIKGYTFTWSHPSGSKMSKLDRFLVSEGIFLIFPSIMAVCLDRHLSDHSPIILCEDLKVRIRAWIKDKRSSVSGEKDFIKKELSDIDRLLDGGDVSDSNLLRRSELRRSVYKVVTKVLANRLALIILDLISDTQSAFVANRQILDGSFILNELLHWCKRKKKQVMFYKVDFAKAYDLVRWDYLLDVLEAFEFGNIWSKWIRGTFNSAKASDLVNGSLTIEFPFYYGLKQGDPLSPYLFILIMESLNMSFTRAIDEGEWSVDNLKGGRLTLLKAVLGASPFYNMSIFKVPKGILNSMKAIRSKFFNGMEPSTNKITWAACNKVLASKENGGLGVSSYHALNRALLLKWVWHFISQDGSLWFHVIKALYGTSIDSHPVNLLSNWCSIIRELHLLVGKGFYFLDHCKKGIRNGRDTCFWRPMRGGSEYQHLTDLNSLMQSVSLSHSCNRWICDLSGDGEFRVKEVRNFLDNLFLPSYTDATRWVKYIPIKINVFVWRARCDFLPIRVNLSRRGILLESSSCPLCLSSEENIHDVLFGCGLTESIFCWICQWWELDWQALESFSDCNYWFSLIRLSSKVKALLEGVFGVAWWSIWGFRNCTIYNEMPPRRLVLFDDIVSLSFNWFSSRCNRAITWDSWLKNPHLISL